MSFIKRPNPTAAKDAEIAHLRAKLRTAECRNNELERAQEVAMCQVAELEADCPECEDTSGLCQTIADLSYDVSEIQHTIKDELCGNVWPQKFKANCMTSVLRTLNDIAGAKLVDRELDLAIASYNLAYCKAIGCPEYLDAKKAELQCMIDENPDMDPRCLGYINKILCLCA